ncbi:MAG: radical SAM protein [Elusimicrobia bacterium]|nr:radical SAM protein [Elusimicrobiota bacterium]
MNARKEDKLLLAFPFGCDIDCVFCQRNRHPHKTSFTFTEERWREVLIRFLALMRVLRRRGVRRLCLGGDEPTMAPAWLLESVVRMGVKEGFAYIELMSNGVKLRSRRLTAALVAAGVNAFLLPVYGPDAAVHDAVTRKKGSYAALLKAIKNIKSFPGTRIEMHTLRLKANQGRIKETVSGMMALGLKCAVWDLKENETDTHVDYAALRPDGARPRKQRAVDSRVREDRAPNYVKYNICTERTY